MPHTLYPIPYILYPIPYTLYPIPYTLYHKPYTLYPILYTLYPIPYTLYLPYTLPLAFNPGGCQILVTAAPPNGETQNGETQNGEIGPASLETANQARRIKPGQVGSRISSISIYFEIEIKKIEKRQKDHISNKLFNKIN